jgi:hypothetical protein
MPLMLISQLGTLLWTSWGPFRVTSKAALRISKQLASRYAQTLVLVMTFSQ